MTRSLLTLDERIGRAEHTGRTVFPDPRVQHPARLRGESTASRCALRLAELDRRAVIGQDAHVVVFVPARQRFREGRIGRLTVGVASRDEQVADADESQGARRSGIALIKEDRWFGDREGLKMGLTNVMNAHAGYVRPNRAIARRFSRPDV